MKKFLLLVTILSTMILGQTQIIDLKQNDASGVSTYDNQTVTVSGVVTCAAEFGNAGPAYIQDATAGIAVYGSAFAGQVSWGDSVTITAKLVNYNGLAELEGNDDASITVHGNVGVPEPMVLTLDQIKNQAWNGIELYEGLLVKIKNVELGSSGTFASGTVDISDSTGALALYVDSAVDFMGLPIPEGTIDIVGCVGQYDRNSPYSEGYQILPRTITDFIQQEGPQIIPPVVASNITDSSFTAYFSTSTDGTTEISWGLTDALELGSHVDENVATEHEITVDGLSASTKYYYKVASTDASGTSESSLYSVTTSSGDTTTGTINVYFNGDVDNSIAMEGNEATGNMNFQSLVISRINSATSSLDLCLYSFYNMNTIANAIVSAKDRGVKVRVVYDDRDIQNSMQQLVNAGIEISQRPSISGIMHNKFMIVDARDDDPSNDWIWTGSFNWTSTELSWHNNVIEINDPGIAEAYEDEFEEMWGSSGDSPNSSAARFGPFKNDNTPHFFNVAGRDIQLYFSPSDGTESKIASTIGTADSSIYFSLLTFTSDPISNAIQARHNAGVNKIRGIISNTGDSGSEFNNMLAIAEGCFDYSGGGTLHNKYGLVDAGEMYSDPYVITGSHNWSNAANTRNDENTLIIKDIKIANLYAQEFKALYNQEGGTGFFKIPADTVSGVKNSETELVPETAVLHQNYPNPFNPVTSISFELSDAGMVNLAVYNILGEKVATIVNRNLTSGKYVADFNASELPSGLYIYTLTTNKQSISKKMMLLK